MTNKDREVITTWLESIDKKVETYKYVVLIQFAVICGLLVWAGVK